MSPRRAHTRTPEWIVKSYKNKGKQILHGPYVCPKCGINKIRIQVNKEKNETVVVCDNCNLECPLSYAPHLESVDYYNKFMDEFARSV